MRLLKIPGDKRYSAADNGVTCLLKDSSGKTWISTYDGLWSYSERSQRFSHEINEKNDPKFSGLFTCAVFDHQGNIWMGTWDRGLKKYNPVNKKLFTYPVNHRGEIISLAEIKQSNGSYLICFNGYLQDLIPLPTKKSSCQLLPSFQKYHRSIIYTLPLTTGSGLALTRDFIFTIRQSPYSGNSVFQVLLQHR